MLHTASIQNFISLHDLEVALGMPSKKYIDREIVPIPSDIRTIQTVSEYLDSEYW